jgi:TetR/AcrR family transcriptional repressor of nem operon
MAGRPKIFDEQEVIDRAVEVFWMKGYEASSADELLAAMGIGKGSFYLAFKGGKKELFEKSLKRFSEKYHTLLRKALAETDNPVQFIKDFFMALADDPESNQAKGCYLGNALIEMSSTNPDTQEIARRLLVQMEGIFTDVVRQAQAANVLATKEKPEIVGRHLINLWNGVNVTRRMYPSDPGLKAVLRMNLQILD